GTGRPYSSFLGNKKSVRNFIPIVIGLEAEREVIYERINARVDAMVENGLIDEATKLYPHRQLNALQTVGYRELFSHFDGEMDLVTAIEEIKKNTRRFAKRQMTWFRRNESVHWFNYATNIDEIINYINLNK
ncbi:tRNA delta(2)-isopentenylpyrophosphate transferase, partial [Nostoc linckia z15]